MSDDLHIPRRAYRPTSWWTQAETGEAFRAAAAQAHQQIKLRRGEGPSPDREGR